MEDYARTLQQFEARFSTEEGCREYLFRLLGPEGFPHRSGIDCVAVIPSAVGIGIEDMDHVID